MRRTLDISILIIWVLFICTIAFWWILKLRWAHPALVDILLWSRDVPTAATQLQKSYDWTITQWSGFATAVLVAVLGFLSTVVAEFLKGTYVVWRRQFFPLIIVGVSSLLAAYSFANLKVSMLNDEFVGLYSLLSLIHSR